MALSKTRVTGRLPLPDDQIWQGSYVEFHLTGVDTDKATNDVLMPGPVVVALDDAGRLDASLWPNTRSAQGTNYRVTVHLMSPVTRRTVPCSLGQIVVPIVASGATVDITDLLAMEAPLPSVPDLLAQALAAAARAEANASSIDDNADKAAASAVAAATSEKNASDKATAAAASAKQAADTASSVGIVIAPKETAEAGADNGMLMTSLRTFQAFVKHYNDRVATAAQVIAGAATNLYVTPATLLAWLTDRLATQADAEAGTATGKLMTPLRVVQYVSAWFAGRLATQAQAAAGAATDRIMTPLATEQHMLANALGWGQSRATFTAAQRPSGTVQTNDTGRPIEVTVMAEGGGAIFETSSDGTTFVLAARGFTISSAERLLATVTVPAGHRYRVTYGTLFSWSELR